jgi:hypothetical protein
MLERRGNARLVTVPGRGEHPGKGEWRVGVQGHPHARFYCVENLESGASIDEIIEWFHVTREQVVAVLEFAARSLDPPAGASGESSRMVDARSL